MTQKFRNPLAQALGLALQVMRDKMGGMSSSEIAYLVGLAASHYRMIEAGSATIQPSRAIRLIQTFDTIEFVPLCQILIVIQLLDAVKDSISDMRTTAKLLAEANPALTDMLDKLDDLWPVVESEEPPEVAKAIVSTGLRDELMKFLTTEPATLAAGDINDFMSPTYQHPLSGALYSKIGNILQGVAPFYLDTVLQLIDNLRNVTPRVTAEELAKWEKLHKNRFSHIIGIVRNPEVMLDVTTFDYSYLWEDTFRKILVLYRDKPTGKAGSIGEQTAKLLREKFELEHLRYEHQLETFDKVINEKLVITHAPGHADDIDNILLYGNVPMNNLWAYITTAGYVVPFIDNATAGSGPADLYGTSPGYDETSEIVIKIRKLLSDMDISL